MHPILIGYTRHTISLPPQNECTEIPSSPRKKGIMTVLLCWLKQSLWSKNLTQFLPEKIYSPFRYLSTHYIQTAGSQRQKQSLKVNSITKGLQFDGTLAKCPICPFVQPLVFIDPIYVLLRIKMGLPDTGKQTSVADPESFWPWIRDGKIWIRDLG